MEHTNKIVLFQDKAVRRTWFNDEWWFVVEDIIAILTNSTNPKRYLINLKKRDKELAQGYDQIGHTLPVETEGGTQRMSCANLKGLFRIIMSMPSSRVEPLKLWLAEVGQERIEEIEDPERASKRIREIYKAKGYSDDWIEKRLRGIAIRDELTGEWQKRGVKESRDFAILTAEITRATFGMLPSQYKNFKALDKPSDNLRDHMNDLELIFSMLGEASTTEITRNQNTQGFNENFDAAVDGGTIAGNARRALEKKSGKAVSTAENFKHLTENRLATQKDEDSKK